MTCSVIFLVPSFYEGGELNQFAISDSFSVCAHHAVLLSLPQALQDLPICSVFSVRRILAEMALKCSRVPSALLGPACCSMEHPAQPLGLCPAFGSLPNYGFSSSLWIFTQPLDFHPAFGSSLNLFVFAQPLCLHPTFGSSPNLWVFTQPLVFTQIFKAEACCSCNRMNPVYLFVFIVSN